MMAGPKRKTGADKMGVWWDLIIEWISWFWGWTALGLTIALWAWLFSGVVVMVVMGTRPFTHEEKEAQKKYGI